MKLKNLFKKYKEKKLKKIYAYQIRQYPKIKDYILRQILWKEAPLGFDFNKMVYYKLFVKFNKSDNYRFYCKRNTFSEMRRIINKIKNLH